MEKTIKKDINEEINEKVELNLEVEKDVRKSTMQQIFWFISVARNAIVVIACAFVACILEHHGKKPFSLTGTTSEKFTFPTSA